MTGDVLTDDRPGKATEAIGPIPTACRLAFAGLGLAAGVIAAIGYGLVPGWAAPTQVLSVTSMPVKEGNPMLILSRRVRERIMINGGEIVVSIQRITGDVVRIGIEAPRGMAVDREELFEEKRRDAEARRIPTGPGDPD